MAFQLVYTDAYRKKQADIHSGDLTVFDLRVEDGGYFKIGEGGNTAGVPDTPDQTKTDIEATALVGAASDIADEVYFKKLFVAADGNVTDPDDGTLLVTCTVASGEANDDGLGNNPIFYEIGIFDPDDTMLCYGTFDGEEKVSGRTLEKVVTFNL